MTKGPPPRQQQTIFDLVEPRVEIPEKLYFKIGEVCSLTGMKQHVLRYWEKEFSLIHPYRGPSKQRLYRRKDVELVLQIKKLVHDEGYTIAGAKKHLARERQAEKNQEGIKQGKARGIQKDIVVKKKSSPACETYDALLHLIKKELVVLQRLLERNRLKVKPVDSRE